MRTIAGSILVLAGCVLMAAVEIQNHHVDRGPLWSWGWVLVLFGFGYGFVADVLGWIRKWIEQPWQGPPERKTLSPDK